MAMNGNTQNHHIIPKALLEKEFMSFLPDISKFRDDKRFNLIGLPTERNDVFTQHLGSHPEYTDWIREQIEKIDNSNVSADVKRARLIGLTNVMKMTFAEPGALMRLNGLPRGEVYDELNKLLPSEGKNSYRNRTEFRAAEMTEGALPAARRGSGNLDVDGQSPFNCFNDVSGPEQHARPQRLRSALDTVVPELEKSEADTARHGLSGHEQSVRAADCDDGDLDPAMMVRPATRKPTTVEGHGYTISGGTTGFWSNASR